MIIHPGVCVCGAPPMIPGLTHSPRHHHLCVVWCGVVTRDDAVLVGGVPAGAGLAHQCHGSPPNLLTDATGTWTGRPVHGPGVTPFGDNGMHARTYVRICPFGNAKDFDRRKRGDLEVLLKLFICNSLILNEKHTHL
jgi:hypothetical protein